MLIKNIELFENNLAYGFLKSVNNYPDRPALWINNMEYTYCKLYNYVLYVASQICKFNFGECLIFGNKTLVNYIAILASLITNKTYVPINNLLPIERNLNIIKQISSRLIIADKSSYNDLSKLLSKIDYEMNIILIDVNVDVHNLFIKHNLYFLFLGNNNYIDDNFLLNYYQIQNYAYLLFTSGSTGVPKGVPVKHNNIIHYIKIFAERALPNNCDKFIQLADLTFDFSVHDCFNAWGVGACLYVFPNHQFLALAEFINKHQITFWGSVPSVATLLLEFDKLHNNQLNSLRYSMFCGEALSETLASSWNKIAPNSIIENFYGPTEAAVCFTGYRWQKNNTNNYPVVPIGKPFKNLEVLLVNDQLRIIYEGIGEMLLSGPQVVDKYWENTELTNKSFIWLKDKNGILKFWYRTGDLAEYNINGNLIYKGRSDDQIQIRGNRVERLEIESIIKKIANTKFVAVVPWPYAEDGTILGVIAYLAGSMHISEKELRKECMEILPDHMIPKEFHYLDQLPYNANYKIDYKVLKHYRENMDQKR